MKNETEVLERLKNGFFHDQATYRKSTPDLFVFPAPGEERPLAEEEFAPLARAAFARSRDVLLYIHFPFCRYRCNFCSAVTQAEDAALQAAYARALLREIDLVADAGFLVECRVRGVYLGGGTPTNMAAEDLEKVLTALHDRFRIAEDASVTCEAHPQTMIDGSARELLARLRAGGVNRISIGSQSLDEQVLAHCGRKHSADETARALDVLREGNWEHNVDMMIGLPGQTLASVERDLAQLERLRPAAFEYVRHAVCNPQVRQLYREHPELRVGRDELFAMNLLVKEWLWRHGYEQDGCFSRENTTFPFRNHKIREMPYWGFGARAASHLGDVWFFNHADLTEYETSIESHRLPRAIGQASTAREQMYRMLHFGLQTREGVDRAAFAARFGEELDTALAPTIARLRSFELVRDDGAMLQLTRLGAWFLEDVACVLDADANAEVRSQKRLKRYEAMAREALGAW